MSWARDVCSSNLAIVWTVNQDDSLRVVQRRFTHEKPWGNQNSLQVAASDCLVQQMKCRVSFMNHQSG